MVKAKLNTIFSVLFLVMVVSLAGCSAEVREAPTKLVDSFIVAKDISLARADVEAAGGEINHIFSDDKVLMGKVPSRFKSKHISKIYYERDPVPKKFSVAFNAWTKNLEWKRMPLDKKMALVDTSLEPIPNDVISFEDDPFAKDFSKEEYNAAKKDIYRLPWGADATDTSLYMMGDVSVSVILPESNGGSEDWTPQELSDVRAEVLAGLDWWRTNNPDADLTFVSNWEEQIPTTYEPIEENSIYRHYWGSEVLYALGYGDGSPGITTIVYDYINDQRESKETDWAFVIFIVDSSADADGMFNDDLFAFTVGTSYNGGVYSVMTYDNEFYGIDDMDAVTAHETGHIFGALDQYDPDEGGPLTCSCTNKAGYLDYENQNCENGCLLDEESIMRGEVIPFTLNAIDDYAKGQIGWVDTDEDAILDILDTEPNVFISNIWMNPDNTYGGDGYVQVNPFTALNINYNNVSINDIFNVDHRFASTLDMIYGGWFDATPSDGAFDAPIENYVFISEFPLDLGISTAQFRAINDVGNSGIQPFTGFPLVVEGCIDLENGARNFDGLEFNTETNECTDGTTVRNYFCDGNDIVSEDILCTGGCSAGICQDSLIRNPSFEFDLGADYYLAYTRDDNILGNLIPDGWNTYHGTGILDDTTAYEGTYSVKVSPGSSSQTGNVNQYVPVEMGKTYIVSGWMKVDEECQANPDCKATLGLHCDIGQASVWNCPIDVDDWDTVNSLDWTYVETEFTVDFPDTTHLELACYNSPLDYSVDSGYVWCDSFGLEEVVPVKEDKPGKLAPVDKFISRR